MRTLDGTRGSKEPNFAVFWRVLLWIGPSTLTGVEEWMREWLVDEGGCSELLWQDGMDEVFMEEWPDSPTEAVQQVYRMYIEEVQTALLDLPVGASEGWVTSSETGEPLNWYESVRKIDGVLDHANTAFLVDVAVARMYGQ